MTSLPFAQTSLGEVNHLWRFAPAWMQTELFWAVVTGAMGIWLIMPTAFPRGRSLGMLFGALSLALILLAAAPVDVSQLRFDEPRQALNAVTALLAVLAIVATVIVLCRPGPVTLAIWFGLTICSALAVMFLHSWLIAPAAAAITFVIAALLLVTPGGQKLNRVVGVVFLTAALGLLGGRLPLLGDPTEQVLFGFLSLAAMISAVATIASRSPVYCAIWFSVTLLSTAGLLLLQGAAFLGVATVAVYAGAILVMFLFVLMLAQPEGHAFYDRISWGWLPSILAALASIAVIGGLTHKLTQLSPEKDVLAAVSPSDADQASRPSLEPSAMVKFGGRLYSRHLIEVEMAGVLLLAGLVGAVVILLQGSPPRE